MFWIIIIVAKVITIAVIKLFTLFLAMYLDDSRETTMELENLKTA